MWVVNSSRQEIGETSSNPGRDVFCETYGYISYPYVEQTCLFRQGDVGKHAELCEKEASIESLLFLRILKLGF